MNGPVKDYSLMGTFGDQEPYLRPMDFSRCSHNCHSKAIRKLIGSPHPFYPWKRRRRIERLNLLPHRFLLIEVSSEPCVIRKSIRSYERLQSRRTRLV